MLPSQRGGAVAAPGPTPSRGGLNLRLASRELGSCIFVSVYFRSYSYDRTHHSY
jgi:hypothetical protein